jgi:hypothetical protein
LCTRAPRRRFDRASSTALTMSPRLRLLRH